MQRLWVIVLQYIIIELPNKDSAGKMHIALSKSLSTLAGPFWSALTLLITWLAAHFLKSRTLWLNGNDIKHRTWARPDLHSFFAIFCKGGMRFDGLILVLSFFQNYAQWKHGSEVDMLLDCRDWNCTLRILIVGVFLCKLREVKLTLAPSPWGVSYSISHWQIGWLLGLLGISPKWIYDVQTCQRWKHLSVYMESENALSCLPGWVSSDMTELKRYWPWAGVKSVLLQLRNRSFKLFAANVSNGGHFWALTWTKHALRPGPYMNHISLSVLFLPVACLNTVWAQSCNQRFATGLRFQGCVYQTRAAYKPSRDSQQCASNSC